MARAVMFPYRSPLARTLAWVIAGLLAGALACALVVTPSTLYPYQAGKGFAVRILIELAGFFYVWLMLIEPSVRPARGVLFWSVMAYAAAIVVTALTGVDPYGSWWGNLERMEGVLSVLHGVAAFVIAAGLFRTMRPWVVVFRVSLAVSAVVAWYAIAQLYPWARFLPVHEVAAHQPGSTLGYASFASTYALIHIFIAGFLVVLERSRAVRIAAVGGLALNLLLLGLAATRGAYVGLLAAVLVGAVVFLLDGTHARRQRLLAATALLFILGSFAGIRLLVGTEIFNSMPHGLQRMATISTSAATAQTRLIALGVSWDAWKERPVLGWGPEQFDEAYRRHFDPAILSIEDGWFDRAHNKVAEVAVQSGALGALVYLSMFGVAGWRLAGVLRGHATPQERTLATLALMLGCAYFVQNLFLFDTSVSTLLFYVVLAFVSFLIERNRPGALGSAGVPASKGNVIAGWKWIATAAGVVVAWMIGSNVTSYRAASEGFESVRVSDPSTSLQRFRSAVGIDAFPTAEVVRTMLSTLVTSRRVSKPEWGPVVAATTAEAERLNAEGQADHRLLENLGKVYNRMGSARSSDAERVLRQVTASAPRTHEARFELGLALMRRGEVEAGLEQFREVVALNERYAKGRWMLGVALVTQQRFEEALREIERAIELGYAWDTPEGRAVLKAARERVSRGPEKE